MTICIVHDSQYGHTQRQAEAIAEGIRLTGAEAQLMSVASPIDWEALAASEAIIFGSPTYNATVSARFKQFMEDATRQAWVSQLWRNKLAAGFTNSGAMHGDKLNSLITLALFAAQHGMIWVGLDLFAGHTDQDQNRIGSWLGAMAQSDDASPDITPIDSDLQTARYLGQRVAELSSKFQHQQ